MLLTFFTIVAAAALGGSLAVGLTVLAAIAATVLFVLGVTNGLRTLGDFWTLHSE